MIRNNQVLQRLGVSALASILNNTSTKSKGGSPEDSGSLYDAHDSEDSEHEEVDKVSILLYIRLSVLPMLLCYFSLALVVQFDHMFLIIVFYLLRPHRFLKMYLTRVPRRLK